MTEQEKREKAIEEITTLLCSEKACSQEYCKKAQKDKQKYYCLTLNGVERLYDSLRRKEEEVRKKTAEAIIGILNVEKGLHPNVVTDYQDRIDNVIKFIKKEFGVEVEENDRNNINNKA